MIKLIDSLSERIRCATLPFTQAWTGKLFLSLVMVGPFTFIPTLVEAWTAPNIDALRTLTWPMMIVVNSAALLSVIHNGDWRMRLVMFVWILMMAAVWVATLVR